MTLFLFPTELEATTFKALCPDARVYISGVGMVATATTLIHLYGEGVITKGCCVVLAGIAGAYDRNIQHCEVVEVVEEYTRELPERFCLRYDTTPATSLRRVSSNTVHGVGCAAKGADIENMEGASLFAMAEALGFSAVEIRAISNYVGEPFEMWRVDDATAKLAQELKKLITNDL